MEEELDYCLTVIENAKRRGNLSCQVPIWARAETIEELAKLGYSARQVGFDSTEPYHHLYVSVR
jgi:hypothetical protein